MYHLYLEFLCRVSEWSTPILLHILYVHDSQGLCEWRDTLARADDESTGYIIPNKIVLEIGK